ncbi:PREDICTED: esterase B1-like [Drosophila arizonae]|uniref:carboxylesterase n=1 Tax=Drosophila arizonae TaxID=7263 RepID=A0ABM1Q416_DROAR|nr:PREDICTED: esterase B1-like [Drosophila arizonae]
MESTESSPVVQTTHGQVRGALLTTLYDDLYYSFDGIPYAEPPLGELRFREPQDAKPWRGTLDCTVPKDKCFQVGSISQQIEGSEDCLYLNIAAKSVRSEKPLPVMVYVHGGMFRTGDATRRSLGPDYLMREQVIYVSIGYRLGPFGFLSFADPSLRIPGNAGLKDIILALKWIKANVGGFNGDANNITLFGHSSGSCIVHLLAMSPQAEGLFNKAILMAGHQLEIYNDPDVEYKLARHLGYEGEKNDMDVFNFINATDPELLIRSDYRSLYERMQSPILFLPRVEYYATPTAVVLEQPRALQGSAWGNRLPFMMGCTSSEGLIQAMFTVKKDPEVLKLHKDHPEFMLPAYIRHGCAPDIARHLGGMLVKKFCGVNITYVNKWHFQSIADLFTHHMLHYQDRLLKARLKYSQAANYLYRFDVDSPDFNFYRVRYFGKDSHGAVHADELGYLFKLPVAFKLEKTRPEYAVICRFVALFTEFARSSNPNGPLTKQLVDWRPVTKEEPTKCLNINEELKFITQPESLKLKFYEQLYFSAEMDLI